MRITDSQLKRATIETLQNGEQSRKDIVHEDAPTVFKVRAKKTEQQVEIEDSVLDKNAKRFQDGEQIISNGDPKLLNTLNVENVPLTDLRYENSETNGTDLKKGKKNTRK